MDNRENTLISVHGYCSQEVVNLMLTGKASSNVFNGEKDLGDDYILRGIKSPQELGFLTLFEYYGNYNVGSYLKNPALPIWVICSESHYFILFSNDLSALQEMKEIDLIFYDQLMRQEKTILLTLKLGKHLGGMNEMDPPIEKVIRTKWQRAFVDWNGSTKIL